MNLGNAIKNIRKQKGLKQNKFAEMCQITHCLISQIENNAKDPNLSTLKISQKLDTPLPILRILFLENKDVKHKQ